MDMGDDGGRPIVDERPAVDGRPAMDSKRGADAAGVQNLDDIIADLKKEAVELQQAWGSYVLECRVGTPVATCECSMRRQRASATCECNMRWKPYDALEAHKKAKALQRNTERRRARLRRRCALLSKDDLLAELTMRDSRAASSSTQTKRRKHKGSACVEP
jgi:hypothetical protein